MDFAQKGEYVIPDALKKKYGTARGSERVKASTLLSARNQLHRFDRSLGRALNPLATASGSAPQFHPLREFVALRGHLRTFCAKP